MLTGRGVAVSLTGLAMWVAARTVGSSGLEIVGLGLSALPLAALVRSRIGRPRLTVRRHLSDVRVPPGNRVTVELDVANGSGAGLPLVMLEDRLPPALGRGARLVVVDLPARRSRRVSYTLLPQARGRYALGPVVFDLADAFGLTRRRVTLEVHDEVLVTPEVEDLQTATADPATGTSFGGARARQLLRVGQEYYTMRAYQLGDDLRRIHWPSVARTGDLMIRQDEATRRATGVVFLDDRRSALGQSRSPGFERAVSVAASIGVLLARSGFRMRYATPDLPPTPVTEDRLLDMLSAASHGQAKSLGPALAHLRSAGAVDTSLVLVTAPMPPAELTAIVRAGTGFGPRLAVLVHPVDPASLPPDRMAQVEGRASQARLTFARAGWDCIVLTPSTKLVERWHAPMTRPLASNA